jgi:uncharacterized protein (DUF2141 family)
MSSFRWRAIIACLFAAGSSLASIAAQTRPVEKNHSLSGQILDALTGRPVTDVELALSTAHWETAADPVMPDSQGRFVFHGLAPGEYVLSAARPDFGTIYFGELPDPGEIQTIRIGREDKEKVVAFRLIPRSSVAGVIRDEFGDAVVRASVTLLRPMWSDGTVVLQQSNQAVTDDRGQFRINNLVQGTYVVCAIANSGGNAAAPSSSQVDFLSPIPLRYYARSCRPSLRISAGQRATADLTITSTSGVRIHGRIVNSVPNLGMNLRLVRDDPHDAGTQFWPVSIDSAKATFEFRGVPPGKFRLESNLQGQTSQGEKVSLSAQLPIVVGTADLDAIELALEPTGEIEVALHGLENNKPDADAVSLGLRSTTQEQSVMQWANSVESGSPRLTSIPPGSYWLLTRSKDKMCVQSAKLGTHEALHGTLRVASGASARLDVTVSPHCGIINGRVMSNEQPVPDAKVLLLLSGSAKNPGDLVTGFTDDQGDFSFPALPFGRYQLWAWSVDEFASFVGPMNLADDEKHAITVSVNGEEPVTVELTLLKPEVESR